MDKFILYEEIGDVVNDIVSAYDNGKIRGIMVCILGDDNVSTIWSGMNYLERRGAVEVIREDMQMIANKRREEC